MKKTILISLIILLLPATVFSGKTAPDFSLKSLDGKVYRLSDLKGKVVVLNFWASWCPDCLEEMPSLQKAYNSLNKDGLVVLGISIDRKREKVSELVRKLKITYPILLDSKGEVFIKKYTVIGLPSTFIIDKNGEISERIIGRYDFNSDGFIEKIQRLLTR